MRKKTFVNCSHGRPSTGTSFNSRTFHFRFPLGDHGTRKNAAKLSLSLSLFLSSKIHARLRFRSRHEQRLLSSNNSYHAVLHFEKRKRKRKREEGENGRKQNCRVVIIILFPQNRRFGGRPESFWNFKLSHLLQLQKINRRMNFLLQLYVLIDKSNEWRNFLQCVRFSSKAKLSRMTTLLVFHRHKSKWDILRVQPCHLFV